MDGYDAATYGDRFADVYDDWYDDPAATDAAVRRIAEVAAGSSAGGVAPVLELGVGTGRLALPLAERRGGRHRVGRLAAMLERLAAKPGAERWRRCVGDMAGPLPDGPSTWSWWPATPCST